MTKSAKTIWTSLLQTYVFMYLTYVAQSEIVGHMANGLPKWKRPVKFFSVTHEFWLLHSLMVFRTVNWSVLFVGFFVDFSRPGEV